MRSLVLLVVIVFSMCCAALAQHIDHTIIPSIVLQLLNKKATSRNLLNNSNFELDYQTVSECDGTNPQQGNVTGTIAGGWLDNSCWSAPSVVSYTRNTNNVHSGVSAQQITLHSGLVQFGQILSLKSGFLYKARVWLRAETNFDVTLLFQQIDEPYTYYAQKKVSLSTDWREYFLQGIAVTGEAYFMITAKQAGSFTIDDAALYEQPVAPPALPAEAIPIHYFGLHFHSAGLSWVPSDLGVGTVRIWDAVQWAEINTAPGVYDWTTLDAHVDRALQNGADIVFNLARTPHWASARPNEYTPYADIGPDQQDPDLQGQAAEPADIQYWRDWVNAVGNRYKGKIKYWEIWNEPNYHWFWTGTTEQLVALSREAYTILKSIDPGNRIISPSPYDAGYLDEYLQKGGGNYADIIGYHFYLNTKKPEFLYEAYVPAIKLIMQQSYLGPKPLWDTENGWPGNNQLSDEHAAGYIARAYLLEWAAGVKRFYFYAWDELDPVILAEPPNYVILNQVGKAYAQVSNWLSGSRMLEIDKDRNSSWVIKISQASGGIAYIVWNPDQDTTFHLPKTWAVTSRNDLSGNTSNIQSATELLISHQPVLLY